MPPCFCFDVHFYLFLVVQIFIYFLENKYHFEFSHLHPFLHVLAAHVVYIYIYNFYFFIFMNWFVFPPFMFCLLISQSSFEFQTSLLVFVVWCDHESQNSTPKATPRLFLQRCCVYTMVWRSKCLQSIALNWNIHLITIWHDCVPIWCDCYQSILITCN